MTRTGMRRQVKRAWSAWILLSMLILEAGCVLVSDTLESSQVRTLSRVVEESRKSAPAAPSLEEGLSAFEQGDLPRAAEIFAFLTEALSSDEGKRKALYGLACSRLAMAKDKKAFQEAMVLWEKWQEQVSGELGGEDPRMLSQVIKKLASWAPPGEVKAKKPSPAAASSGKQASTREEEIRQKEEEIRLRDEEIERLREQIEALENIHRDIERKKKGAASP